MSVLEQVCNQDGCPQCWADMVLATSPEDIEAELQQQITSDPRMRMVGLPEGEELHRMVRSGRRETQFIARLVLLQPHECGKDTRDGQSDQSEPADASGARGSGV